jgi:succinate dehydrogenase / fumarate reductase cytochrome b subunit
MTHQQNAPVFLNLFRIRMPAGAVASIAHRISGVLLFLSLPLLAWLLDLSLQGGEGYERAIALLQSTGVRLASVVLVWSLLHHLVAGIRFLLIDVHLGVSMPAARLSAWFANLAAALMALLYAWWVL